LLAVHLAQWHMHTNPARDIPYLKREGDGFHTWTEEEIAQFEHVHPVASKARSRWR